MTVSKLLEEIHDVEVELGKDLSNFSTMKLNAVGDLITVKSVEALKETVKKLNKNKIKYIVLGMGANQLLKLKSDRPYLMLKIPFDKSSLDSAQQKYVLPASVRLSVLTSHASKFGLKNWEVFTGVPATLGGAIFMNAGTGLGEICEIVSKVWLIDTSGNIREEVITDKSFSYRKNNFINEGEVVYQVELLNKGTDAEVTEVIRNYLAKRNASQPMKEKTCGCVFKNSKYNDASCAAGKFIDIIGMKGFQINGIRVSSIHGNFMENVGDATFEDVKELIATVKAELKLQYGIDFELEVVTK